jgi:hypothetical protein
VSQDLADRARLEDEGEDSHRAAALLAEQRVDLVDPADEPCPEPAEPPAFGGIGFRIRERRETEPLLGLPLGLLPRNGTVGSSHIGVAPIIPHLVKAGFGDVLEQPGKKLRGLEGLDRPVESLVTLVSIEHPLGIRLEAQSFDGHGRAEQIPSQPLDARGVAGSYCDRVVGTEPRMTPGQQQLDTLLAQEALPR